MTLTSRGVSGRNRSFRRDTPRAVLTRPKLHPLALKRACRLQGIAAVLALLGYVGVVGAKQRNPA